MHRYHIADISKMVVKLYQAWIRRGMTPRNLFFFHLSRSNMPRPAFVPSFLSVEVRRKNVFAG